MSNSPRRVESSKRTMIVALSLALPALSAGVANAKNEYNIGQVTLEKGAVLYHATANTLEDNLNAPISIRGNWAGSYFSSTARHSQYYSDVWPWFLQTPGKAYLADGTFMQLESQQRELVRAACGVLDGKRRCAWIGHIYKVELKGTLLGLVCERTKGAHRVIDGEEVYSAYLGGCDSNGLNARKFEEYLVASHGLTKQWLDTNQSIVNELAKQDLWFIKGPATTHPRLPGGRAGQDDGWNYQFIFPSRGLAADKFETLEDDRRYCVSIDDQGRYTCSDDSTDYDLFMKNRTKPELDT